MSMRHHAQQGFSLIEMAVVLGIVTLILGFGLTLGGNAMRSADRVNTQQRLQTIQDALESYVKTNGYLPCPASRAESPAGNPTTFGTERRSGASCNVVTGMAASGSVFIGAVPVRALGLPDSYAGDAWSNKFTYAVSQNHVNGAANYGRYNGGISIKAGDRTGTNYFVTSYTTDANRTNPHNSSKVTYGPGATYVVVSHGPDGTGSYPLKGTVVGLPCAGGQNDGDNCNDDDVFWDTTYNDTASNTAQYFDDYIAWGSNARQREPIQGTTPAYVTPAVAPAVNCTGGCESWCAPCAGTTPNLPPSAPGNLTAPVLCSKIITSTSPCTATCVWSGVTTSGGTIVRCP